MSVEGEPRIPTDVEIGIGNGNGGVDANDHHGGTGDDDANASTAESEAQAPAAPGLSVLAMVERIRSLRLPSISLLPSSWRRGNDSNNANRRRADDGDSIGTIHLSDLGGSGDEFDDDGTIVEDEAWLRDSIRRIRESRLVAANKDMGDKFIRTRVTAVAVLIVFLVLVAVLLAVLNGKVSSDEAEATSTSPIGDVTGNVTVTGVGMEDQP